MGLGPGLLISWILGLGRGLRLEYGLGLDLGFGVGHVFSIFVGVFVSLRV